MKNENNIKNFYSRFLKKKFMRMEQEEIQVLDALIEK